MQRFRLKEYQTTMRQELLAGLISFFTISYIIVTNPIILSETGLPPELTVFSTIFVTALGCLMMGWIANTPLVIAPGMGENAFFTYTMVATLGLTYQQSLTGVLFAGLLFFLAVSTGLVSRITLAIPTTLKQAIPIGIGLFLVLIGLNSGGLVMDGGENSFLVLGDLSNPLTLLVWGDLFITAILMKRSIKGSFLIGMALFTLTAFLTGLHQPDLTSFSLQNISAFPSIFGAFDFSGLAQMEFWLSVLSLTLLLLFGAIGMIEGLLHDTERSPRAFNVTSITVIVSALFGTSPAVPLAESASGIKEGGRTGLMICSP